MNQKYINQVNMAINFILDHLEEDLTVESVAEYCCFSKYYFNRLFKAATGESVYSFIKRLRIERSAFYLKVNSGMSITDVAVKYNLSSSNYSTAFKEYFGISPSKYRKIIEKGISEGKDITDNLNINNLSFPDLNNLDNNTYKEIADNISFKDIPDLPVIYERHKGHYNELSRHWDEFCEKTYKYMDRDSMYLDISYDDPMISDVDACIYDLCMTVKSQIAGFDMMTIKGGKSAIYKFDGPLADIGTAYQRIFSIWLPGSSIELDDRRIMSIYNSQLKEDGTLEMDIYIPIK